MYGRLFDWLVALVNAGVRVGADDSKTVSIAATVGVLDIFGFECFARNSLEQLCINYANGLLKIHEPSRRARVFV